MEVFTDGACSDNGTRRARGAWAFVFPKRMDLDRQGLLEGPVQTNNRAEFTAALKALEAFDGPIHIHTDSNLLVKIATGQWKPTANLDLVEKIAELSKNRAVTWTHVKAHTKRTDHASRMNDEADRRATGELKK